MTTRCGSESTCACVVQPAAGVTVTGTGTAGNPYRVGLQVAPGWQRAAIAATGPLTVDLDGGAAGQPAVALTAYTPVVADVVAVIAGTGGYLILGPVPPA